MKLFLDVCPASLPNAFSCTRYLSCNRPIIDTYGTDTSCQLDVRTPNAPAKIGVPNDETSSPGPFQNRTMPRLYGCKAEARAAGVSPGIWLHGNSKPPTSSSPTPLPCDVLKLESETVIDHVKFGTSTGSDNRPVIVSYR